MLEHPELARSVRRILRACGFALGSAALSSLALGSLALGSRALGSARAAPGPQGAAPARTTGCLADGSGYFRARIRGAMNLDLDWRNGELECEGGARASGGVRLSFAGPLGTHGRRLRLLIGVSALPASAAGNAVASWHALPTNLTVIVEGAQRLFATRGDDKCTMDSLRLEPLHGARGASQVYRAVARGFCTAPASGVTRNERILVTRFDFAGRLVLDAQ